MTKKFGVHSEVGRLRTVMVCRPGPAHKRLRPREPETLLQRVIYKFHPRFRGAGFNIIYGPPKALSSLQPSPDSKVRPIQFAFGVGGDHVDLQSK
jgi:arginine deiminase